MCDCQWHGQAVDTSSGSTSTAAKLKGMFLGFDCTLKIINVLTSGCKFSYKNKTLRMTFIHVCFSNLEKQSVINLTVGQLRGIVYCVSEPCHVFKSIIVMQRQRHTKQQCNAL